MLLHVDARYMTHVNAYIYIRARVHVSSDIPRFHRARVETATLHGLSLALVSRQNFLGFLQTRELETERKRGGEERADERGINGIFARGKYAG